MHVLNSLIPIFTIVALGAVLRRSNLFGEGFFDGLGKLCYWIGLPAFLFEKIATSPFAFDESGRIFSAIALATATVSVAPFVVAEAMDLPRGATGTFVQAAFRSNFAYVGLPVVSYVFAGPSADHAVRVATLAIAPTIPLVNVAAVVVLEMDRGQWRSPASFASLALRSLANPLVAACLAGLACSAAGVGLPAAAARALNALGGMSLSLALLSIGGGLTLADARGNMASALAASILKVVVLPAAGLLIARFMGLEWRETLITAILLACPAAAASYVVARQLGGDASLAGNAVLLSTILSAGSLWAVIALCL